MMGIFGLVSLVDQLENLPGFWWICGLDFVILPLNRSVT